MMKLTRPACLWLAGIVALGVVIRVLVLIQFPTIAHSDEIFQYLEQANRLVDGRGLVPWEYEAGARSWLLPGLLAGVMRAGLWFGPAPGAPLAAVAGLLCLLGVVPIVCGFLWGWGRAALPGAIAAGVANAVWFEIVYYAVHPLAETFATAALVGGLYLIYPAGAVADRRRLFLGAFLLGLTMALRLQIAPAVLMAVVAVGGVRRLHGYRVLLPGLILPLLGIGLLDWITLGWPFRSMAMNVYFNSVISVAAQFGTSPPWSYVGSIIQSWGPMAPVIGILALVGAYRLRLLFAVAAVIFLVHSAFGHKEDRFISPMLPLVLTLAAIGSALLVDLVRSAPWRTSLRATLVLGWAAASLAVAMMPANTYFWQMGRGAILADRVVNADPKACGVAILPGSRWPATGGYVLTRPDISLYSGGSTTASPATLSASNYVIAFDRMDPSQAGYQAVACWTDPRFRNAIAQTMCLWHRPGGCVAAGAEPLAATIDPDLARLVGHKLRPAPR